MYKVDVYLRVRRSAMVEGMNIREAARTFGLHRDTVRKMLAYSVPPGYRRQTPPGRHQRYFRRAIAPRPPDCGLGPLPWAGVFLPLAVPRGHPATGTGGVDPDATLVERPDH